MWPGVIWNCCCRYAALNSFSFRSSSTFPWSCTRSRIGCTSSCSSVIRPTTSARRAFIVSGTVDELCSSL